MKFLDDGYVRNLSSGVSTSRPLARTEVPYVFHLYYRL